MPEPPGPTPPQAPHPPAAPRPWVPIPQPPAPPPSPPIPQKPRVEAALKLWGAAQFEHLPPGATLRIVRPGKPELKTPSKLPDRVFSLTYQPKASHADYLVDQPLGEGGMGIVYAATQQCLNRPVAVKTIKPGAAAEETSKKQFLSEALITGKLDHPNVVPVHEMGANGEGLLFYSMKQVRGISWSRAIREKTLEENLDILLRVSDAVAFAHDHNILHCDLKPENVMLGDYGEVYVMDWGLALSTRDLAETHASDHPTILGGTPAYMPPEFAHNDTAKTGTPSDIYLLGAILYEILTGRPPHTGTTLSRVIASASSNEIPPIFGHAELAAIALKSMSTDPGSRHASVKEFQQEIRAFRTHLDSLTLADTAHHHLSQAETTRDYGDYSRALHGFEQALNLWKDNPSAGTGLVQARERYARLALVRADLDLAESLLDRSNSAHQALLRSLDTQRRERDHRRQIMRRMKFGIAGLLASIILILSVAQYWVQAQRNAAREEAFINGTRLAEQHLMAGDWPEVHALRSSIPMDQAAWEWEWLEHNSGIHLEPAASGAEPVFSARHSDDGRFLVLLRGARTFEFHEEGRFGNTWGTENAILDFRLATRQGEPELLAWDGRALLRFQARTGTLTSQKTLREAFTSGSLDPAGSRLLLLPQGEPPGIYDTSTGRLLVSLNAPGGLQAIEGCLSADGKRAAILTDPSRQVVIHDALNGQAVIVGPDRREAKKDRPDRLAYLPNGSALLVCGFGRGIGVHDPNTLTPRLALSMPAPPSSFAASPDNLLLAGGSEKGDLLILDMAADRVLWRLKIGGQALTSLFFDQDSKGLHIADAAGNLFHLPLKKREPWQTVHQSRFPSLNLLADSASNSLYLGDQEGQLWRLPVGPSGKIAPAIPLTYGVVARGGFGVTQEPAGRFIVFAGKQNMQAYDLRTGDISTWASPPSLHRIAISPDGKWVALLTRNGRLELYASSSRKRILDLSLENELPAALTWFPDSSRLAVGFVGGPLQILDPENPTQPLRLQQSDTVAALAASPDGRYLAASSIDRNVQLWDLQDSRAVFTRNDFEDLVLDMAFTPDQKRLLCASGDGKIHVLDLGSFRRVLAFQAHRGAAIQAVLSPAGSTLFTAGTDGEVRMWSGTRTPSGWNP